MSLGTSENADTSRAQGRCYLSDRSLSNFMQLRPCSTCVCLVDAFCVSCFATSPPPSLATGDALAERSDSQCQAGFSATVFTSGDNVRTLLFECTALECCHCTCPCRAMWSWEGQAATEAGGECTHTLLPTTMPTSLVPQTKTIHFLWLWILCMMVSE